MSKTDFSRGIIAYKWWEALNGDPTSSDRWKKKGNPAALARLRRASTPIEALAHAEAIRLATKLGIKADDHARLQRVGTIAAVLAHVKNHDGSKKMAQLLGPPRESEQGSMSELRFHRLIAAREPADLMRQMRGAVKLLKGTANIKHLAASIYDWDTGERGDKTRIDWTYAYWGAAFASPTTTDTTDQSAQETA